MPKAFDYFPLVFARGPSSFTGSSPGFFRAPKRATAGGDFGSARQAFEELLAGEGIDVVGILSSCLPVNQPCFAYVV